MKNRKRKQKKLPYWASLLIILLVGVASWSVYQIFDEGISQLLLRFGITNIFLQNGIIVACVMLILILVLSLPIKKAIDKLVT